MKVSAFIIHLTRAAERKAQVRSLVTSLPCPAEIMEAVDGREITDDQVAISTKPDCGFRVIGWVDAQNGFGAQIRSKYVVDLKYLDDEAGTWQLTDINIR